MATDSKKTSSSSSKKKEKSKEKKDKKESSKKKSADVKEPAAAVIHAPSDPDAVHLFRRYDVNRTGMMTRAAFLRLLQDYADASKRIHATRSVASTRWMPLSLTDFPGTPLGYERTDRNSEFEAGQLFERYDKKRSGMLTIDDFQCFFADFKIQLRAFVDDLSYQQATTEASKATVDAAVATIETSLSPSNRKKSFIKPEDVRPTYQSTLWQLHKICKEDLKDQREFLLVQMAHWRKELAENQVQEPNVRYRRTKSSSSNQNTSQYEAMEHDLEEIEEILHYVRRHVRQGDQTSVSDMELFLRQAPALQQRAQTLAMKEYEVFDAKSHQTSASTAMETSSRDLQRQLRIKDQVIYELLQERAQLRRDKATMETYVTQLSAVSTQEMKKWAALTDDMQHEIACLRGQLT